MHIVQAQGSLSRLFGQQLLKIHSISCCAQAVTGRCGQGACTSLQPETPTNDGVSYPGLLQARLATIMRNSSREGMAVPPLR
jgi:hypothetical protein